MSRLSSNDGPPLLTGGRRRRRRGRAALLLVALLLAVALVSVAALDSPGSGGGGKATTAAKRGAGARLLDEARGSATALAASSDDASRFAVDLSGPDAVRLRFTRKPRAGLLFDVQTGRVLWRYKPLRRLPIASLTKMMTALVLVEHQGAHERVRITRKATKTPGSAIGVLPRGRNVQFEALLNGLLLVSGNDAAVALAQHSAGGVKPFVRLMNERAQEMRLSCTRFTTPHGLRDRGNHSCAADLGTLARADLSRGRIRRIVARRRAILKFPIKGGRLFLYNNNTLMRSGYRGVTGLKTGYTDRAGRSIVATARHGHVHLGVVLLHSYDPATQARKLLDRGFEAVARERRP